MKIVAGKRRTILGATICLAIWGANKPIAPTIATLIEDKVTANKIIPKRTLEALMHTFLCGRTMMPRNSQFFLNKHLYGIL